MTATPLKQRLPLLRRHFNLSQAQFANLIHRSPGFISNVETGSSDVSEETVELICRAFPEVNREWLVSGTGEMLRVAQAPVDMAGIGGRVREVRMRSGLSQARFGSSIGFSKMHVFYVENGKSKPSEEFLSAISRVFGISLDWLKTGVGGMDENTDDSIVDDDLIDWLKALTSSNR